MNRLFLLALLAGGTLPAASLPAAAFWQRSQVSRCNDATTEAERQRLRCWELNAYADPGWPALGAGLGLGGAYYLGPPPPPVIKGGVTRRLG
ncbi:hypothetical protein [Bosea sp. TAF32]|uniref:hypothetical protein n=1 Tax=Bosea sp. TAF32 TaxID=3237482 RepID=UPI003F8FE24F